MADPLQGPDTVPGQSDQTVDFLGRPAPISFKSQPALPSASGGLAPSTGPATTSGGIGAKRPAVAGAEPPSLDDVSARLREMLGAGGGETGSGPEAGNITGFDAPTFGSFLSTALGGIPGLGGLAGKGLGFAVGKSGIGPNLTVATEDGRVPAVPGGRVNTGLAGPVFSFLAGLLGIAAPTINHALTSVFSLSPEMQAAFAPMDTAQLQSLLSDPIASQFVIDTLVETVSKQASNPNQTDLSVAGNSTGGKTTQDIDMALGKAPRAPDAPTAPPGTPDEGGTPGPPGGEPTGLGDAPGVGVPE